MRRAGRDNKRPGAREQPRPDIADEGGEIDWYACDEPYFVQRARAAWLNGRKVGDGGDAFYGQLALGQQSIRGEQWKSVVLIDPACRQEQGGPRAPVRWGRSRAHLCRPKPRGVTGGGGGVARPGSNVEGGAPRGARKSGWRARARASQARAAHDGTRRLPGEIKAELGLGCAGWCTRSPADVDSGGQPAAPRPRALDAGPQQSPVRATARAERGGGRGGPGPSHLAPAKRRLDMGDVAGSGPFGTGGGGLRLA